MSNSLKRSLSFLSASIMCFGQSQSPATMTSVPPSIEQVTPPPFDQYPLSADSTTRPGVPVGRVFTFEMNDSKIFPGTTRTITVYLPAAYDSAKPACVYVGLDGLGFHAPTVFDNLIAHHAMPVTIGIGVSSGTVASAQAPKNPRFDRSFEFDSRSDRLAAFLLEEVIPAVEKQTATDGSPIRLSKSRNDRAIGGASTGAIAAFTVAWERPDAFSRVFSAIGTYVGMRGGEGDYVLVRKTEPKPLRIFMEDGIHDEWPGGPEMGDWWMSNQTMERALTFAGYDVRHVWGAGTHNDSHASALFPEAMRWLWRDWPAPIQSGASGNPVLQAILQPGEDWQVAEEHSTAQHIRANAQGQLQMSSEKNITFKDASVHGRTVRFNGDTYVTIETRQGTGELWLIRSDGKRVKLDSGLKAPSGLAFSPDGLWLFVAQSSSQKGISYRVRTDGTVDAKAPFYEFYVPSWANESGAGDIAMDKEGRAYVATLMGIQVFDRNGRVTAILPLPTNQPVTTLCFGGPGFHTLYAVSGGKVFRRILRSTGAPPWAESMEVPSGNAG